MAIQLDHLEKKEKKAYEALAALLTFVKGGKKQSFLKVSDFNKFKKMVLASANDFNEAYKTKTCAHEPKFNVKHYERAILCASDVTYRDMAIQAASKDLAKEAMRDLILALRKACLQLSRQVKEQIQAAKKTSVMVKGVQQLWQNVVVGEDGNEGTMIESIVN